MKKVLLTIFFAGIISASFAQDAFKLILDAGINSSTFHEPNTNVSSSTVTQNTSFSSLTSFHIELLTQFDFGSWSIQPGLKYTSKGGGEQELYSQNFGPTAYTNTSTVSSTEPLRYLEIPVNVLYNIPVKGVGKVFVGGGPYLAFGLSGSYTYNSNTINTDNTSGISTTAPESGTESVGFGSNGNLNSTDFGLNGVAGFAYKDRIIFKFGYGLGLSNIVNGGFTTTNRVLSISLGYAFF